MCAPYLEILKHTFCYKPRHKQVEASSVGLCQHWRWTFWTLLMITTLKLTMSKWQHC